MLVLSYFKRHPNILLDELVAAIHKWIENARWVQTGCVISTHAGPDAFGVGGIVAQ